MTKTSFTHYLSSSICCPRFPMAAVANDASDEAQKALANRIAKRQRWLKSIHDSCKYQTVKAVIMAGEEESLPEILPATPRPEKALSKRHWESMCQRYRHSLQRLYDYINASAQLRSIVQNSTHGAQESNPPTSSDTVFACLQS